jgi:uncharacterized protein (TIGR02453 family)
MAKVQAGAAPAGPFRGFSPGVFTFFDELAANQNRDWFQANKDRYEAQVRRPMGALVEALAFAFAAHDIPLTGDAKRSLFRINRDVRFSKDKSPYKTAAGAVLSRDGTKNANGVFYFHVGGPERAFMAIGFYQAEPQDLAAIRHAIAAKPEVWSETEASLIARGLPLSREGAQTRIPKGFETLVGSPVAEALKQRNFIVSRPVPLERLYDPGLIDDVVAIVKAGRPLLEFGWRALYGAGGRETIEDA